MPDYSKGKIYTIRCRTDETLIYVGSTIQPLSKRWGGHKLDSVREHNQNRLIYITINNNWDDWYIELYEVFPCENKEQLCKREGEIIREIGTLNIEIAGRTRKEYINDNKDKFTEYNKQYNKQYYNDNKDYYKEYSKQYRNENEDKLKEYKKQYYNNNKDDISNRASQKITCECGCILSKNYISSHKKSPKHIKLLDSLNNT